MKKIFLVNFMKSFQKKYISKMGGSKYDNDLLKVFMDERFNLEYFPVVGSVDLKIKTLVTLIVKILFTKNILYFFRYPFVYWNKKTYKFSTIYQYILFKVMNISKNKIGVIISDLDYIRNEGFKSTYKEIRFLKNFHYIIVHNNIMKEFLIENGLDRMKLISQDIGNNLSDNFIIPKRVLSKTIIFSGNLSKSKFLYKFNSENIVSYKINLYGVGFNKKCENKILEYRGTYSSEEIVKVLDGSFGLIWDGNSIDTCSGFYGEYTKINNPSKFSQYIVAGLPVIAWKEAAIADVVNNYKIGFVVNNLMEIDNILDKLTEKEYQEYIKNVMVLRNKVMTGYHFKKAVKEIINTIEK